MYPIFTRIVLRLPVALAYVAAISACAYLVHRNRDWASLLALVGFTLLLTMNVLFSLNPFFEFWMQRRGGPDTDVAMILGAAMLAESTVAALAIGCLTLSLWLGLAKR